MGKKDMKEIFQISPHLTLIQIFKLKEMMSVNFALGFLRIYSKYVKFWVSFTIFIIFSLAREISLQKDFVCISHQSCNKQ